RFSTCASDFPSRAVLLAILSKKIDLGITLGGAATEDRACIFRGYVSAAGISDGLEFVDRDTRKLPIERQTQRIEDRRFAGPGITGDRKETCAREWLCPKVNLEFVCKAG